MPHLKLFSQKPLLKENIDPRVQYKLLSSEKKFKNCSDLWNSLYWSPCS